MDAKSKANFINSVADGQIPCPTCNTLNQANSLYCASCGAELSAPASSNETPAFAPVTEEPVQAVGQNVTYVEPTTVFADGLPSWDIVPPQVMVRRH